MNPLMLPNPNLGFWLERRAQLQPERQAIVYWHKADVAEYWTYGELESKVQGLAAWMVQSGIQAGDRVAFLDFNDARFVVVMFAAARIGAIFVPLNFRLSAPEIVATMNDCGAALLIYGDEFRHIQVSVKEQCDCQHYVFSSRNSGDEFMALCAASALAVPSVRSVRWDETAWLLYTSGSTGRPKGVMLSHGNVFWNTINTILIQGGLVQDRVLISAPLFHAAPVSTLMESFLRGALLHLEKSFDPTCILERIAEQQIAVVAGVPAMYKFIAEHVDFMTADLSSLRSIVVGGAPVPEALINRYGSRGIAVIQRYGLTEAAPLVTALTPGSSQSKGVTAGLPPIFGELRISNQNSEQCAPDEIGEIQARGPNIMQGYWRSESDTRAVLRDGWLHTGDLGRIDDEGYLTVVGRIKDMIITGGENVYAAEVEAKLAENPDLLEAVVIGVPDPKWGETICAIVSLVPGRSSDADGVVAHLQGRLARYKQPKKVIFLDALPKNGAGKIDKLTLKREYGGVCKQTETLETLND